MSDADREKALHGRAATHGTAAATREEIVAIDIIRDTGYDDWDLGTPDSRVQLRVAIAAALLSAARDARREALEEAAKIAESGIAELKGHEALHRKRGEDEAAAECSAVWHEQSAIAAAIRALIEEKP